jgi:hypothetical protein
VSRIVQRPPPMHPRKQKHQWGVTSPDNHVQGNGTASVLHTTTAVTSDTTTSQGFDLRDRRGTLMEIEPTLPTTTWLSRTVRARICKCTHARIHENRHNSCVLPSRVPPNKGNRVWGVLAAGGQGRQQHYALPHKP